MKLKHVITNPGQCPIRPADIDTSEPFNAFGDTRMDHSAFIVVKLCQMAGRWEQMDPDELRRRTGTERFNWNGLVAGDWIVEGEDDLYRVTIEFVARCYAASPVVPAPVGASS